MKLAGSKFQNRPKREVKQGEGKNVFFSKNSSQEGQEQNEDSSKFIRQTYHIEPVQKKAIALMAAHEQLDKSEIVRKALESYIPKKYIQMAMLE